MGCSHGESMHPRSAAFDTGSGYGRDAERERCAELARASCICEDGRGVGNCLACRIADRIEKKQRTEAGDG